MSVLATVSIVTTRFPYSAAMRRVSGSLSAYLMSGSVTGDASGGDAQMKFEVPRAHTRKGIVRILEITPFTGVGSPSTGYIIQISVVARGDTTSQVALLTGAEEATSVSGNVRTIRGRDALVWKDKLLDVDLVDIIIAANNPGVGQAMGGRVLYEVITDDPSLVRGEGE